MIKKLTILILVTFTYLSGIAQAPSTIYSVPTVNDMKNYFGKADRLYVESDTADYVLCRTCTVNDSTVYSGVSGRKWLRLVRNKNNGLDSNYIKSLIKLSLDTSLPSNTGLISTGGITLVDSTLTIHEPIKWVINGTNYTKITPSVFIINSEDSGYYRRDLIHANKTGNLYKIVGVHDPTVGVAPNLPDSSVSVTIVDIFGNQIFPPEPIIITKGKNPTLQQVTNRGNTTTDQIIDNYNGGGFGLTQNSSKNGYTGMLSNNTSNGTGAGAGFLAQNNIGHIGQIYMGSNNNAYIADGLMVRSSGASGMRLSADIGAITFGRGLRFLDNNPPVDYARFDNNGTFNLFNYKNSIAGDSVLTTDVNGKVILKKVTFSGGSGSIDSGAYRTATQGSDSLHYDLNRPNGTGTVFKFVFDTANGGGGTGGNYTLPIASASILGGVKIGSGLSIDGSGVLSATGGAGSTYTASNGLTAIGNDIQLGGSLTKSDTLSTQGFILNILGTSNNRIANIENTGTGKGLVVTADNDDAINAASTSGTAIGAVSVNGTAISAASENNTAGQFDVKPSSGNSVVPVLSIVRSTSGVVSAGIGLSIDLYNQTVSGGGRISNKIISKWLLADNTSTLKSSFVIQGVNDNTGSGNRIDNLTLNGDGALALNQYGLGTFTGTPTYNLGVDASGNIIEIAAGGGGGGGTYTASNGLTMNGSDIQLGGTLTGNTIIATNLYTLNITGNQVSQLVNVTNSHVGGSETGIMATVGMGTAIKGVATGAGIGLRGESGGGWGVQGYTTSGFGVMGQSVSGNGIFGTSETGLPGYFSKVPSTTNTVETILKLDRTVAGTPANGIAGSIDFAIRDLSFSVNKSNQIISKLTNVTSGAQTSEFSITGVDNAITKTLMKIDGTGDMTIYGIGTAITATGASFGARLTGTSSGAELSGGNTGANLYNTSTVNNTVSIGLSVQKSGGGSYAGASGVGVSIIFGARNSASSLSTIGSLAGSFTNTILGSELGKYTFSLKNGSTEDDIFTMSGTGVFTLVKGLTDYADNAAAIAGGLTVGQLYRNGDIVQIVH